MPLVKKTDNTPTPSLADLAQVAIGTVDKQQEGNEYANRAAITYAKPKQRDFDAEARGKTRCALYGAALQSQGLANFAMTMDSVDKYLELVKKAAEEGVKYSFGDE